MPQPWNAGQIPTNLMRLRGRVKPETAVGLALAAEFLGQQSDRDVPLDQGPLQNSRVAAVDRESLRAVVSYNTPYAVRQHEDMTYRHPGGRKAKFLEGAFTANTRRVGDIIAAHLRGVLR